MAAYLCDRKLAIRTEEKVMNRKVVLLGGALIALAVAFTSCQLGIDSGADAKALISKGTVRIVLPRVNPFVAGAKAFAYVDSVEVDFYKGEEIVQALYLNNANYDEATNTIQGSVAVLADTYDKMIVSVFNHAVSESVPVVSGWITSPIVVEEGQTIDFTIPLYPYEPTYISVESGIVDILEMPANAEQWFAFFAPTTETRVTLVSTSGNLDAYIFGPDALPHQDISGTDGEGTLRFSTPNLENPYYICVISRQTGSAGQIGITDPRGNINIQFY